MPGVPDPRTELLLDPATYAGGQLHALLAELRRDAPLAWNGSAGFWAVTRHADVLEVSGDPARFCARKGILVDEIGTTYDSPPTMMHTDPPEHTRYRALVRPGFTPAVVRSLEPLVRERTGRLLDDLLERGRGRRPVDVVAHFAVPLPIRVIAAVLGMPEDREEDLFRWSEAAIPGATEQPEDERMAQLSEMTVELLELAASRRREPRDDVVSMLAAVEQDGERLNHDELGMFLVQLLVAGNETTRHAISGGLHALAQHPDQFEALQDEPMLVPSAVEEVLRWTTPVTSFMRTTTIDTEVGGRPVAEGDPLLLLYASANRDEAVFGPTADRFDVRRSPNHHVAFGFGPHFCLGAALARLELTAVLEGLVERVETLQTVAPPERTGSSVIAGLRRVELRFRAR